jgi:hypothetical protein
MKKSSQTETSCRYLHQTDFPSRIPRSQKPRNSKGFCEDNLLLQMAEQNSQGGAEPAILSIPTCAPPRQAYNLYILPIPILIAVPAHAPAVKKQSAVPTQKPPLLQVAKVGAAHSSSESSSKE